MLKQDQIYEARISDYTDQGQGIARVEGCVVFVPGALAGERVRVKILKAKKTWAAGALVEVVERSAHRAEPKCPVAHRCGGCAFRHMDYAGETALKACRVRDCLNRIGGEDLAEVPILAAPSCEGYRNKAQYPVTEKDGRACAGFFRAGSHEVIDAQRCLLLPEQMDQVKDLVLRHMNKFRIPAYQERTHTGLVRHIYVRIGAVSGQILVCLAVNGGGVPHHEELIRELKKIPGFATLVLSVNRERTNVVLSKEEIVLYGPGWIEDTLCGLTFRLSARSFYQVNHHQAQRLYQAAIEQAKITKADTVLDLYCGVGTITLAMAAAAKKVYGVEVVPQAVDDAWDNARRNGIGNVEILCADAGKAALALAAQAIRPDVVVVDPPRKGLNADAIQAIGQMAPERLVYISCDPATLARDVKLLKDHGYALTTAQAADLFPRCAHVETVCLMLRKDK